MRGPSAAQPTDAVSHLNSRLALRDRFAAPWHFASTSYGCLLQEWPTLGTRQLPLARTYSHPLLSFPADRVRGTAAPYTAHHAATMICRRTLYIHSRRTLTCVPSVMFAQMVSYGRIETGKFGIRDGFCCCSHLISRRMCCWCGAWFKTIVVVCLHVPMARPWPPTRHESITSPFSLSTGQPPHASPHYPMPVFGLLSAHCVRANGLRCLLPIGPSAVSRLVILLVSYRSASDTSSPCD